jgi:hypothetical protein
MKRSFLLLFAILAAAPAVQADDAPARGAQAHDFPTSGRVEYVLECMQKHEGKYEYLYKCSCVIDHIARQMPYDEYLTMSTALRNQTMSGERGAVFRDPVPVKDMANKYRTLQAGASKACYMPQR